jgi:hypothetical protein
MSVGCFLGLHQDGLYTHYTGCIFSIQGFLKKTMEKIMYKFLQYKKTGNEPKSTKNEKKNEAGDSGVIIHPCIVRIDFNGFFKNLIILSYLLNIKETVPREI